MQAFREIVYKDRTLQTSDFVLDTTDPYPSQNFGTSPDIAVPTANDSPSQSFLSFSEGVIKTVEARDDFRMFLFFEPKGGTRNVVQVAEWSWVGQLKSDKPDTVFNGNLVKDASASRVTPKSGKGRTTTDVPVLSPNITSTNWVTDNGVDPSSNTFANSDRRILDKLKPKADSK